MGYSVNFNQTVDRRDQERDARQGSTRCGAGSADHSRARDTLLFRLDIVVDGLTIRFQPDIFEILFQVFENCLHGFFFHINQYESGTGQMLLKAPDHVIFPQAILDIRELCLYFLAEFLQL